MGWGDYFNVVKSSIAHANDPEFGFNMKMYEIRKELEGVHAYFGIDAWGGTSAVSYMLSQNGFLTTTARPNMNELEAVRQQWDSGELQQRVLSGDPGILAQVDLETLDYFRIALGQGIAGHASNLRGTIDPLAWSGYREDGKTWLDD